MSNKELEAVKQLVHLGAVKTDTGVLLLLALSGEHDHRPAEISSNLAISASRLSMILHSLESDRMIIRNYAAEEGRQVLVNLTTDGLQYTRDILRFMRSLRSKHPTT